MAQTIVLATGNPHKVEELRALLTAVSSANIVGLADLAGGTGRFTEPEETGSTFEANARIKAVSYAAQTGHLCLADDSGLEIDALHGRPGVISSHYSSDGRETGFAREQRDTANNERVMRELQSVPPDRRAARFVCCMCLCTPHAADKPARVLHESRGTFEGRIGLPPAVPRGGQGFGYDPLFLVAPSFLQTAAELLADEKNRLSHRARAAALMARAIAAL